MEGTAVLGRVTWRPATVVGLHDETATARTLSLAVRDWRGHVAGQHVDVRLTAADGYSAIRSYSIASAPSLDGGIEITVERLPDGEVSPYLTQQVMVGDELEVRGPIGRWFVWRPEQVMPIQLVAGGSGIVPLMAMIRSRTSAGSTAPFRLLYSIREPGAIYYHDELQALSSQGDSVVVTHAYTRLTPKDWPRPAGRIDAEVIASGTWPSNTRPSSYVCGSARLFPPDLLFLETPFAVLLFLVAADLRFNPAFLLRGMVLLLTRIYGPVAKAGPFRLNANHTCSRGEVKLRVSGQAGYLSCADRLIGGHTIDADLCAASGR